MKAFKSVSPSQFNTFNDCKRQWWFQSILGLPTPQRASAALGTAVHEQLEAYVDSGKLPADTEAGRIAKAGLSLLPEPGTSWTEVKMHNEDTQAQWPRIYLAGLPVNGYVDLLNLAGKRPLIIDHKTTSDLKYAKKKDELLCDPQMVIYGSFALAACDAQGIEAAEVDAGHIVYLTRGAPAARKTLVTLDRKHLAAERQKLEVIVNEMKGFAEDTSPDKVPGEPSSCSKYGGCHFRDKCRALSLIDAQPTTFAGYFREPSQPATTTPSENLMSTIDPLAALAAIKARKAAEAAGAPPAPVVTEVATPVVTEVATPVVTEVAVPDSQDAARAALLAKYGIKKPAAPAAATETPVSIVPPDAPPQVKPSAFTKPVEVAPAAPVAEPEDKKSVRKPKNYAEKLAALNWTEAQIGRMTPESMREALDGNLDGSRYSVLKDGAIMLPAPVVESDPMPYVAEDNDVPLPEGVTESVIEKPQPAPAPVEAPPAPSLVLYIDCAPEKGRDRTYIPLEDYIQPLCAEAVAIHNRGAKDAERVDFYGLIPYNRGPTYIAAMLLKSPPTGILVCNTRYPATNACLEVLTPFADVIVRASR